MADESGLFSPTNMSTLLAAAMVEKMTQAERDTMLAGAISYLMTPVSTNPSDYRAPTRTPVESAFRQAADQVITKVARERLEADADFLAKIDGMVTDAVKLALANDSELARLIGEAIATAVAKKYRGY